LSGVAWKPEEAQTMTGFEPFNRWLNSAFDGMIEPLAVVLIVATVICLSYIVGDARRRSWRR
jgi:hypothetical protein